MLSILALSATLFALQAKAADNDTFFIVRHGGGGLLSSRLDPVLTPGSVASHTHEIIGTSSFQPTYDYQNSVNGKCTTANVVIDKSSYWVPQMYYQWPNGTFSVMPLSYANTYYEMRRQPNEPVYEFPPGFRMLAGSALRNTYNASDPSNAAVTYVCLYSNLPESPDYPQQQCSAGVRAQVYFPHCWDGVNNWLPGSKHVAYGAGDYDQGGACPSTHPKRIMGLFYEFIYDDSLPYRAGARVLATGDDVGYSFHGDFTNGWPQGFFAEMGSYGAQCNVGFSLENCPPLKAVMAQDGDGNQGECVPEGVMVDEPIGFNGTLAALPGDNKLWGGPSNPKPTTPGYSDAAKKFISALGVWNHGRLQGPDPPVGRAQVAQSGSGSQPGQITAAPGDIRSYTVAGDQPYTTTSSVQSLPSAPSASASGTGSSTTTATPSKSTGTTSTSKSASSASTTVRSPTTTQTSKTGGTHAPGKRSRSRQ